EKENKNQYTVYLTNSGDGVSKHPLACEKNMCACVISTQCDTNTLLKLIKTSIAFSKTVNSDTNEYYEYIEREIFSSTKLNSWKIEHCGNKQLSGSCTYFSIYYFIVFYMKNSWN